jgi:alpha-1,6-mannosyltransferase
LNRWFRSRRGLAVFLTAGAGLGGILLGLTAPWIGQVGFFLGLALILAVLAAGIHLLRGSLPGGSGATLRILVLASTIRLALLLAPPSLSDDVYRYVLDGRLWVAGVNAYQATPTDPAVGRLANDSLRAAVNHRELATIYPPAAEAAFTAFAAAGLGVTGFRVLFALCDLLTVVALVRILRRRGQSPWGAALFAFHPLGALESAGSGHVDALAIALLAWSWERAEALRPTSSLVAWLLATLTKPLALFAAAFERRRWGGGRQLPGLAAAGFVLALTALWSLQAGEHSGVGAFVRTWRHNDLFFSGLLGLGLAPTAARIAAMAIVGLVMISLLTGRVRPIAAYGWTMAVLLLVSPVLHPWYALWLLVAAPVLDGRGPRWTAWTLATVVLVTYALPAAAGLPGDPDLPGFRVLPLTLRAWELAPVWIVLAIETVVALVATRRPKSVGEVT